MPDDRIDEIEKKKRELEAELKRIQDELDESMDRVRTDVSSKLDPVEIIKRHPLPIVGFSILAGFFVGHRRSGGSGERSLFSDDGLAHILWHELKKLATRKAVTLASEYVEDIMGLESDESSPLTNGKPEN